MDLVDTVDEDWRERFRAEYIQTALRHERLSAIITRYRAGTLDFKPNCDISLLIAQKNAMEEYMIAMEQRAVTEDIDLDI